MNYPVHDYDGVKNLYIQDQSNIADRYEYLHDYHHNTTANRICSLETVEDEEKQTRSPGILMIVEAENVSFDLSDTEQLATVLNQALETGGLHLISTSTSKKDASGVFSVTAVMQEGYIIARAHPDRLYCGFDIHLWALFDKHEPVKASLLSGLQGTGTVSAFRIVAGGVFGIDSWKDDEKKRGPRVVHACDEDVLPDRSGEVNPEHMRAALTESLSLIKTEGGKSLIVIVLCGYKKKTSCDAIDIVKKQRPKARVVPFWSCSDIENEFEQGAAGRMRSCEAKVLAKLTENLSSKDGGTLEKLVSFVSDSVTGGPRYGALVVDSSVPYIFARIVYKVLRTKRSKWFKQSQFTAIAVGSTSEQEWQRHFMERFRTEVMVYDPSFRSETLFNSTDSFFELNVYSSGDFDFIGKHQKVLTSIEKKTGLVKDIRGIRGGPFTKDPDWKWSHFFLPEDYDQTGPLQQWQTQVPLGYQTIFQLEPKLGSQVDLDLNPEHLKEAFQSAVEPKLAQETETAMETVGEGCVVSAMWQGGNVVLLWDGRNHVDLNIYMSTENSTLAEEFVGEFNRQFKKSFDTVLRDQHPRGIGRVVNFKSDIYNQTNEERPHWARFKNQRKIDPAALT